MSQLRTREEVRLPAPGTWELDPAHSSVQFSASHLGISLVRGTFKDFAGEIEIAEPATESSVHAVLDARSINTLFSPRDGHLRSPDILDVDRFPDIRFESTAVDDHGDGNYTATGELTIRGVTRIAAMAVAYHGAARDPMTGAQRAGFSATLEFDRREFGVTLNGMDDGDVVGTTIYVDIRAEALLREPGHD